MEKIMLPYAWKKAGWALVAAGAVLTGFYIFTPFRITMPVPVLFSAFLEIKYFTTFRTNIADELVMLTLLSGFFLVVFFSRFIFAEKRVEFAHNLFVFFDKFHRSALRYAKFVAFFVIIIRKQTVCLLLLTD